MKRKKTVGEIFRDEFRAVETTPPDDVWSKIELSLEKKRKKRFAIPFWYRATGIAAVFAIIIGIILSPNSELQNIDNSEISDSGRKPELPDTTFESFERIMKESSVLLQSLVLQSQEFSASVIKKVEINHFQERPRLELVNILNGEQGPVLGSSSLVFLHSLKEDLDLDKEKLRALESISHEEPAADSKKEEKFLDRFSVSTTAGIVYSDNLATGSFLDRDLASYSDHGEVSFSYGIKLSYELTERLNMRTGLNSVTLGYQTDDVAVSSAISAEAVDVEPLGLEYSFIGNLHQNIGLFEVPIEFSYALVDERIRLNLIAGASGLFLDSNSLSLNGAESSIRLGAANNLNTVSVSGNLGFGLDYRIHDNLRLTLEPIFKYQFNTFKSTSSGIAPYMIGMHSGLIYRF